MLNSLFLRYWYKNNRKLIVSFLRCWLFFPALLLAAETAPKLEPVSIQLKWQHSFQFAGYYAAIEQGYYRDEGLDVSLKTVDLSKDLVQQVLNGESEYGVSDCTLLLYHLKGLPVVLINQFFQHSPLVFISHRDSGIVSPYEMVGKKVSFNDDKQWDAPLNALLLKTLGQKNTSKIKLVKQRLSILQSFLDHEVDVIPAYTTSEPFLLQQRGIEINIINPQSYGIDFYGDNLFTSQQELQAHPERVAKMSRATIKGWQYALEHPDEIIALIQKKYDPQLSTAYLQYAARTTKDMIVPELIALGAVDASRYRLTAEVYRQLGLADNAEIDNQFFYAASETNDTHHALFTEEEKNWIRQHPVIRYGGKIDFFPFDFVDQEGNHTGVSYDFLQAISKYSGLKFQAKIARWDKLLEAIKAREIDLLPSIYYTEERGKYLHFTKPYQSALTYFFIHESVHAKTLDDLKGKTIAIPKDYWQIGDAKKLFSTSKILETDSLMAAVQAVIERKADVLLENYAVIDFLLKQNSVTSIRPFIPLPPGEAKKLFMAVRKDEPLLLSILNKSMAAIPEKEKKEIHNKWLEYQENQQTLELNVSDTPFTTEEKNWIHQHSIVRYSGETDWAPFDFIDQEGKHTGVSHDFLEAIAKYSGLKFEAKIASWDELLDAIKVREVDLLPAIDYTEDREKYLLFTKPYQFSLSYFFIHETVHAKVLDDLKGKTIAIPKSYSQIDDVKKVLPELKILETDSLMAAVQAVLERKADVLLENYAVMDYLLKQNNLITIRPFVPLPPGKAKKLFMAVRKDEPLLLSILNKSMAAIPEKEKKEINSKWQGYQENQQMLEFSDFEKKWLLEHPVIRFTGDPNWLPYEAFDTKGHYIGMVAEYLKLLEKKLPIKFSIIPTHSWNESIEKVESGAVDMLSETVDSDLRSQLVFTQAYLSSPVVIVMRNDEDYVDSIDDIKQRRLAVVKDYGYNPAIFHAYPSIKFVEVDSVPKGLLAVSTGEIDALFCTLAQASYQIANQGINNIRIVGKTEFMTQLGFGVRKEFAPLVPLLDRALNSINEREKQQVSDLWGKDRFASKTDYRLISQVVIGFLVLLGLIFLWARRLMQEISRRKESEQQVMRLNRRFALASSVAAIGIWEMELLPDLPIDFTDKIYETHGMRERAKFSQIVQSEVTLNEWLQYAHSDDRDLIKNALATLKNKGGELDFEYRVVRPDNSLCNIYCVCYATKFEANATKIIGVTWDITQRKQIESALEKAKIQAEHANLAKSQFLANMSHEIRTPLNAIIGFTDLLSEQVKDPKLTSFVKTVQSAGHNLLVLINDILDLSKIEAGKMRIDKKMCNPHDLFTELGQIFMMKMRERNLDFILDIDPNIPKNLLLDATRLRQILLNLIGNAVKFTEQGQICLRARTGNEDRIRSKLDLYIDVEDSGIGISEDQQALIFQDFEQLEGQDVRKYGGTGLGLSISQRLVEMMGGSISLSSQVGIGSTFTVHLKDVDISTLALESIPTEPVQQINFLPGTVLVVDDIADNRGLLQQCFAETALTVFEAENGLEAVEKAQTEKIDLILMDIRMPVMNGYQAAAKIKTFSSVPIVALTASVMQDEYERAKSENFDGYLRKPILKADLFKELRRFLPFETVHETVAQTQLLTLSAEELHALPETLRELETLLKSCEQISKSNNIAEISKFADTLLNIGQQQGISAVVDYAQQLQAHIDCFDIVAMKQSLNGYRQLLTQLSAV